MTGVFVVAELEGAIAERIHAVQVRYDPKLAAELPPHVTLIGSSGAGPISPDMPTNILRRAIEPVAHATPPLTLRFGRPARFIQREIVVLPLDPHGPLRELHERLKGSGLPHAPARWPFTPHCTLSYYRTLTPAALRGLLAVREDGAWTMTTLHVYRTREPQPPTLLFEVTLGGRAPRRS